MSNVYLIFLYYAEANLKIKESQIFSEKFWKKTPAMARTFNHYPGNYAVLY
ncbi:MAG: hypothetical protein RLZZ339_2588 [Cyanobacteriota bacterium]|jgi:hypothetical protein|uniref:Uncharacterized protein n=1 Tax=Microcystis aeruginosa NIES-44 TaxID=449439 RepID=A0A0A1VX28_MICAE|nr:hypothetical protein N44_03583 [Microcystis aeruginosa NIES-44]